MPEFGTTVTRAINRSFGNQATSSADVVNCGCSKMAANTALPVIKVGPFFFAVGRIAFGTFLPIELLQELDVLGVVGVLDHLLKWQPSVATILPAWDVDVRGPVLPVVVTAIEDLGAAFDSALLIFDTNMDALVTFEVFWPLESATAASPVAVLPLDTRAADWFPLTGEWVELIALDIKVAVVCASDDKVVEL